MDRAKISENYKNKICEEISKLQQKYNDITLVAGADKTEVPAHRIILSACSPYFDKMFDSQLKESFEKTVIINDVTGDILAQLVRFCYTGEIEINNENVQSLFEVAHLMQMEIVTQQCNDYLVSQLDAENCFGCVALARKYDQPALLQRSHSFILNQFEKIYKGAEFNEVDVNYLSEILKSDHLDISSEEHVFYAILKWVEYEPSRLTLAEDLLKFFRAKHVEKEFLTTNFEKFCKKNNLLNCLKETYKQLYCSYDYYPPRIGEAIKIVAYIMEPHYTKAYVYCASTNTWCLWREVTYPKYDCTQMSIALFNDNLFIFNKPVSWKININSCELVKKFNLPNVIYRRTYIDLISIDEDLYIIGGANPSNFMSPTALLKYESATRKWTSFASMSVRRLNHKVIVLNTFIYAIGGYKNSSEPCASMERYDFKTNTWSNFAPMKVPRAHFGAAAFEGCIYVAGGITDTRGAISDSVERYDPKTDSWMNVASMSIARSSFGFVAHGNALYAGGGISNESVLASFHKYDPKENRWEELFQLPSSGCRALASVRVADITQKKINL